MIKKLNAKVILGFLCVLAVTSCSTLSETGTDAATTERQIYYDSAEGVLKLDENFAQTLSAQQRQEANAAIASVNAEYPNREALEAALNDPASKQLYKEMVEQGKLETLQTGCRTNILGITTCTEVLSSSEAKELGDEYRRVGSTTQLVAVGSALSRLVPWWGPPIIALAGSQLRTYGDTIGDCAFEFESLSLSEQNDSEIEIVAITVPVSEVGTVATSVGCSVIEE